VTFGDDQDRLGRDGIERLERAHNIFLANIDRFREPGKALDREGRRFRNSAEINRLTGGAAQSRSGEFFAIYQELQEELGQRMYGVDWPWAARVFLIVLIIFDERVERDPIVTQYQRMSWRVKPKNGIRRAHFGVLIGGDQLEHLREAIDHALAIAASRGYYGNAENRRAPPNADSVSPAPNEDSNARSAENETQAKRKTWADVGEHLTTFKGFIHAIGKDGSGWLSTAKAQAHPTWRAERSSLYRVKDLVTAVEAASGKSITQGEVPRSVLKCIKPPMFKPKWAARATTRPEPARPMR
jgi:hypothetical protein